MRGRLSARPSLAAQVDEQRSELDEILAELQLGVRSASHYDALEERAAKVSRGITAAFRSNRGSLA